MQCLVVLELVVGRLPRARTHEGHVPHYRLARQRERLADLLADGGAFGLQRVHDEGQEPLCLRRFKLELAVVLRAQHGQREVLGASHILVGAAWARVPRVQLGLQANHGLLEPLVLCAQRVPSICEQELPHRVLAIRLQHAEVHRVQQVHHEERR